MMMKRQTTFTYRLMNHNRSRLVLLLLNTSTIIVFIGNLLNMSGILSSTTNGAIMKTLMECSRLAIPMSECRSGCGCTIIGVAGGRRRLAISRPSFIVIACFCFHRVSQLLQLKWSPFICIHKRSRASSAVSEWTFVWSSGLLRIYIVLLRPEC